MDIIEALKWRYATKEFDPSKKISDEDFQKLLDALVLTPSSYGLQTWKFLVVQDPKIREELLPHTWNQRQVVDASHLIVLCSPKSIDTEYIQRFIERTAELRSTELSELDSFKEMLEKTFIAGSKEHRDHIFVTQPFIALGNLLTVAAALKIDACPIGGFKSDEYSKILGLKEKGLNPAVVCPVGYRNNADKYATREKVRFKAEDLIEWI